MALALQAFWPLAAAAGMARAAEGLTLQICTAHGLQQVSADAPVASKNSVPGQTHDAGHCQLCSQGSQSWGILPHALTSTPGFAQNAPAAAPVPSLVTVFFAAVSPPRGPPAIA